MLKRLRVAVISTGDELLCAGTPFSEGHVYDANAPMLTALSVLAGHPASFLGILPDNAASVRASLSEAAANFDIVITSGGASRGEEDHIVKSLDALGSLKMWQLAIKPGRPMSFGQIGDCVFLGLPGNPVAVSVCFLLYAMPVLTLLGGWKLARAAPLQRAVGLLAQSPQEGPPRIPSGAIGAWPCRSTFREAISARRVGLDLLAESVRRAHRDRRRA